jgi:NADH:ubiquinone oxidoreductase subunit 3 (subunit A)
MTDSKNKLWIAIAISVIIIIIVTTFSYKKYIKPKRSGNIVRVSKYDSSGKLLSSTTSPEKPVSNPVLGFFFIFFFMIIIGGFLYVTIIRYRIAYKSVESGNTALGIAALSPEIGSGISNLFRY